MRSKHPHHDKTVQQPIDFDVDSDADADADVAEVSTPAAFPERVFCRRAAMKMIPQFAARAPTSGAPLA